jgi:hypothetical protein
LIENSLTTTKQTIGFKLLQVMGWKPGESIGIKRQSKKRARPADASTKASEPNAKKKRIMGPSLDDLIVDKPKQETAHTGDIFAEVYSAITRKPEDFRGLGVSIHDQTVSGSFENLTLVSLKVVKK